MGHSRRTKGTVTPALDVHKAKLAESGLTIEDAKDLGMELLDAAQTAALKYEAVPSIKIPYFLPGGEPMSDIPAGVPFYRLRFLRPYNPASFDTIAGAKERRYTQPLDTAPCAYYPRNLDWSTVLQDPKERLIITEGEFKAAKACKEGFPTIALGGVNSFRAVRRYQDWLPSLNLVHWVRREVYICFDSDYRTNEQVRGALHQLAVALQRRGAYVYTVSLPEIPELKKVGLDDYLVATNADALDALIYEAAPLGLCEPLWDLNEKYLYVRDPGLVIDRRSLTRVTPGAFREHLEAALVYQETYINEAGQLDYREAPVATHWIKWPLRAEVDLLAYEPGKDRIFEDKDRKCFNLWEGWGVEPRKGDVKPFQRLVDHLFTGAPPEDKIWFLRWCAYPLRHPGTKMFTSVLLHGIHHGTGKSMIGYTLKRIYGKNFVELTQRSLHEGKNSWAANKQFAMGDDITGSDKRSDNDTLKTMITREEVTIDIKYVPVYEVRDCMNYLFTSNHPDSFFLEDNDRRSFIHEVMVAPLSEQFYTDYRKWLGEGGAEALFDWFLHLDLGHFNPAAPAPRTTAKERMTNNMRSDLGSWVRNLVDTPDAILRVGEIKLDKDIYTNAELLGLYDPEGRTRTTANGMGRELARAGIRQVLDGRPVRLPDGSQTRLYAVRNAVKWLKADVQEIMMHLSPGGRKARSKG